MRSISANPRLLCALHALHMTLFPMAIIALFFKREVGMGFTEILLLQAVFGFVVVLFEFPSGYIADRLGYRRSLVAASVLMALGWSVYAAAHTLPVVIAAEVVLGIGLSLISGTDSALMYESLLETGREAQFTRWSGRFQAWGQGAEGTAALLAGFLYALWPRLPFVLEIAVWAAALALALRLVEPTRERPTNRDHLAHVRGMLGYLFRRQKELRALLVVAVALGLSSFLIVWFITLYAEDAGLPDRWQGPLWAVANYSVVVGALLSARLERRFGFIPGLVFCAALAAAGYLGLGLTTALWGFAWYYLLTLARGLFNPIVLHRENQLIPSADRAGFLSLRSLVFRASFLVIGPLTGLAADAYGPRPALLGAGAFLALGAALGLCELARRRAGRDVSPARS